VSWKSTSGCKSDPARSQFSIYCDSENGPSFGIDIHIVNNANTAMGSYSQLGYSRLGYSRLGYSYLHPQYTYGTDDANTFLAGSYEFQLDEIEVYQKE
jgi:hypothetical protein